MATLEDYQGVRSILEPLLSTGVRIATKKTIRETVEATAELLQEGADFVTIKDLEARLGLGRDATSRRVREALLLGYLVDAAEGRSGKQKQLRLGDPLPGDVSILPSLQDLQEKIRGEGVESPFGFSEMPVQGGCLPSETHSESIRNSESENHKTAWADSEFRTVSEPKNGHLPAISENPNAFPGGTPYFSENSQLPLESWGEMEQVEVVKKKDLSQVLPGPPERVAFRREVIDKAKLCWHACPVALRESILSRHFADRDAEAAAREIRRLGDILP
jgi:hypothetical protein